MGVKAFELVPAIERLKLMQATQITCIECCGKNLYIGTDDCFVVHFLVEEKLQPNGRVTFTCEKQTHKYLALKKPVVQLKAASALNRVLLLCDNTLNLLNMFDLEPIPGSSKVKNVAAFCLNEHPVKCNPFSIEIGVALRKRQIQIYTVTEDRMILLKEVSSPEMALTLGMDGAHVCVAALNQYFIVNFETGQRQELFPYNSDSIRPYVSRISKDEFLLSAPSALGMFATSGGISQRPPLQWSDNLIGVAYCHPYILALNDEFITIHSIVDQQQKQSIPFQGGVFLGGFDGHIFVASSCQIYALVPVAIEKQIQALIADQRGQEALDLAQNARKTGMTKEKFAKEFQRIQQQVGFIEFKNGNLDRARELLLGGRVDVREIISLYPMLLPASSQFRRAIPPLHEIADVTHLTQGNENKLKEYKRFLIGYLEEVRDTARVEEARVELDTALLKLYAETNSPEIVSLIVSDTKCDLADCEAWLNKFGHHHAMALLYKFRGNNDQALTIWSKLTNGEFTDESFPGLPFIVEVLANLNDPELIWKYIDQLMEKDEIIGVKVFTDRPEDEVASDRLSPEIVTKYLAQYPKAVIIYLEYLVYKKKSESEHVHTHLAALYLDRVLQMVQQDNTPPHDLHLARIDLQKLLQQSNLYRVQMMLGKLRQTELHQECAILYAKLEEHDKALRILVHKLRDYSAAENYCKINSEDRDHSYRKRLFLTLLQVYLDPSNERRDTMVAPAVSLLNKNYADFDTNKNRMAQFLYAAAGFGDQLTGTGWNFGVWRLCGKGLKQVLQSLPDNWSVGLLSGFLTNAIRHGMNVTRMTRVHRMLARAHHLETSRESIQLRRSRVSLSEDTGCAVCDKPFTEPSFVRYPNGVVTHTHCSRNKNLCPVTGKLFSTQK